MSELVFGQGADDHIESNDIGALMANLHGAGTLIMNGCGCEVVDSNTVRFDKGQLTADGRLVAFPAPEEIAIQSGVPGRNRIDLLGVRYTKDADNIEDAPLVVMPGTPTEGEPVEPSFVDGNILENPLEAFKPVYALKRMGTAEVEIIPKFDGFMDSVRLRMDDLSPAMLYGGTWERIDGMLFMGMRVWRRVG